MQVNSSIAVTEIDGCLPQTQCTMCGYPSCIDYATALSQNQAPINRCPPGGSATLSALSECLGIPATSLAEDCETYAGRKVAKITESQCIGCALCIEPCPVDAIIGASQQMHVVLPDECTGCNLCVDFCPVDCIQMVDPPVLRAGETWPDFLDEEVSHWRDLANRSRSRLARNSTQFETAAESQEIKRQIRSAVNRERTRRWKVSKRAERRSRIQSSVK